MNFEMPMIGLKIDRSRDRGIEVGLFLKTSTSEKRHFPCTL